MRISVVIPTLNESENISALIPYLKTYGGDSLSDLIVVDASSTDGTVQTAKNFGANVIEKAARSRAAQMNLGAREAKGDILYFVHADAKPPKTFAEDILYQINKGNEMGCYRFKFDSKNPFLAINSFFTRFSFLWCRGGDQTLYIQKSTFEQHNGFDEAYIVMEDFDLIRRVWKKHSFVVMPKSVLVSPRKYKHNSYFRVNIANLIVFLKFKKGKHPKELKDTYYRLIKHPKDL